MSRRRDDDTAVLAYLDDDWTTRWRCAKCGYGNVGRERCIECGAKPPAEVTALGRAPAEAGADAPDFATRAPAPPPAPSPAPGAGGRAGRTVAAIIGLNLVFQVALAAFAIANSMDLRSAVRLSLVAGLLFYGAAALWVVGRSASLGLRPALGRQGGMVGAAEGFVVGGGLALLMVAVLRLVLGHPALDPTAAVLAADGGVGPLLLGFLLIAVAAPVVEELVFRGFLAEALRGRGRWFAVLISAAAFSVAHLRLAQFRYYLFLGVVLGLVYWRRGLIGSVCAHAAFNGMLLVVALAATHGPPIPASAAGATVALPAAWVTATNVASDDLVAVGPTGTRVELAHAEVGRDLPPPETLARAVAGGGVPMPANVSLDYATVIVIDLPAGRGVSVLATVDGHPGQMVMVAKGQRLWLASVVGDGGRSTADFNAILQSWRLP